MREYRIQCEDDPWPAGQRPIGSAHPPAPVTFTRRDLQRACPLTCNGTAIDVQSSTVARSHPTELATEQKMWRKVWVMATGRSPGTGNVVVSRLVVAQRPR